MGIPVLILGESGSGKSASLRNFRPDQVGIFNVGGKPLPFRSKLKKVDTDSYKTIMGGLSCMKTPSAVIDDAQYLMANEFMRRCKEVGFQKFTDMATSYWQLVQYVIKELPADRVVYFLSHIERDNNGNEKCKTIGKMLDEKITVEGMFTVVLKTHVQDGRYPLQYQQPQAPARSYYTPMAPIPQQQTAPGLIQVTGLEGAKAYPMSPNTEAALFDGNRDVFYLKRTDAGGYPTIEAYEFKPLQEAAPTAQPEYVTRQEFEELRSLITAKRTKTAEKKEED